MLLKLDNIGKIYDSDDIFTIGIRGVVWNSITTNSSPSKARAGRASQPC